MNHQDPYHIDLIRLLQVNWRIVVFPTMAVALLSSAIMLLKPNYYASTAVFYPVSESLAQGIAPFDDKGMDFYGNASDIDRILSVGQSSSFLYEFAINQQLQEEYNLNINTPKGQEKLLKKAKKLFTLEKTSRDAIRLSMEDRSPERAQRLAQSAFALLQSKLAQLNISSLEAIYTSSENQRKALEKNLAEINDTITQLRLVYGVYDTKNQGEALAQLELSKSTPKSAERILRFSQGIDRVNQLVASQEEYARQLTYATTASHRIRQALDRDNLVFHSIESPALPFVKSRPMRSMYVLAATISAAFLCVCYLLIRVQLNSNRRMV